VVEVPHGESEGSTLALSGLRAALFLALGVLLFEAVGAVLSRSLSVTVDAIHDIPDLFAFAISYFSLLGTARGPTSRHTFGSHRIEVFAAILNAFVILTAGIAFAYPALLGLLGGRSLLGTIDPIWILFAAVPTLFLRTGSAAYLGRIPKAARDLNVRSVLLHLATDVTITVALIADAVVLTVAPKFVAVDAGVALLIAGILVVESIPIFQAAWTVLTERVPPGVSLPALTVAIQSTDRVREVHDLHVWAVCPTLVCMTAHVRVDEMPVSDTARVTAELRRKVETEFGILHSVFELESGPIGPVPHGDRESPAFPPAGSLGPTSTGGARSDVTPK